MLTVEFLAVMLVAALDYVTFDIAVDKLITKYNGQSLGDLKIGQDTRTAIVGSLSTVPALQDAIAPMCLDAIKTSDKRTELYATYESARNAYIAAETALHDHDAALCSPFSMGEILHWTPDASAIVVKDRTADVSADRKVDARPIAASKRVGDGRGGTKYMWTAGTWQGKGRWNVFKLVLTDKRATVYDADGKTVVYDAETRLDVPESDPRCVRKHSKDMLRAMIKYGRAMGATEFTDVGNVSVPRDVWGFPPAQDAS